MRRLAIATGLLAWSWLWFLPVGGFHDMFRCGVLGWAILDNENAELEVRWSAVLLPISIVVWSAGIGVAMKVATLVRRER